MKACNYDIETCNYKKQKSKKKAGHRPTAVCSNWGFGLDFKVHFVFGRLVFNL